MQLSKKCEHIKLDSDNLKGIYNIIEELNTNNRDDFDIEKIANVLLRGAINLYFCHEQL